MQNNDNSTNHDFVQPVNPISPQHNIKTLDLMGEAILGSIRTGQTVTPDMLKTMAIAIAQVRVYCTFRDQADLTDENSMEILRHARLAAKEKETKTDGDEVAVKELLADLRRSGIEI